VTPSEYIKLVLKTESTKDPVKSEYGVNSRILHACMGTVTESAELIDACKKSMFYGKTLDKVNLAEEAGDILWYIAVLCDELNITFEELFEVNINKLKKRYGDKFSDEKAENRDIDSERKILEDGHSSLIKGS
jgi:NTP pyrophosphatase (non-canonical NTP hydrolase)